VRGHKPKERQEANSIQGPRFHVLHPLCRKGCRMRQRHEASVCSRQLPCRKRFRVRDMPSRHVLPSPKRLPGQGLCRQKPKDLQVPSVRRSLRHVRQVPWIMHVVLGRPLLEKGIAFVHLHFCLRRTGRSGRHANFLRRQFDQNLREMHRQRSLPKNYSERILLCNFGHEI